MDGLSVRGAVASAEKKREKEYTPKQKKFLTLYAKNNFQDSRECAIKAGYRQEHYWRVVNSLKDDIKDIATAMLLGAAPKAATTVVDVMTTEKPIPNAATKLKAATEILDRTGVVKEEKVAHEHKVAGGIFLLPMKQAIEEQVNDYIDGELSSSEGDEETPVGV